MKSLNFPELLMVYFIDLHQQFQKAPRRGIGRGPLTGRAVLMGIIILLC